MPKLKTYQSADKRVTITRTGKILRRKAGQDHFNAREDGKTGRTKRRDLTVAPTDKKNIKNFLPYC
jgi:large subunit ribosomal protein L35